MGDPENLAPAVSLHDSFARPHQSLTIKNDGGRSVKRTPAIAAGVEDRVWSLADIASLLDCAGETAGMDAYPQIHTFAQGNPEGPGQDDVPTLLRRVADSIERLGPARVQDIAFANDVTENGLRPHLTVYFLFGDLGEDCRCGHCAARTPQGSN